MISGKKCFAIDYSYSTYHETFYHTNVRSILNSKFEDGDEIIIWDTKSKFISKSEYDEINRTRDGNGCTDPKCIFDTIFSKYSNINYSEFILISDGEIYDIGVEELDRKVQENKNKFKCDYTEVYLLGSHANLSIACPFTRFSPSKTIVKNGSEKDQIIEVSDADLKTIEQIDKINTLDEFNDKFDSLEKAFVARCLGTDGDIELRKSVLLMQKRINANNVKKPENINDKIDQLLIQDKNYDEAKEEAVKCFSSILSNDFQSRINLLIRMCDGGLKQIFDINKLQTFRELTAYYIPVNEVDDIQNLDIQTTVQDSTWECPISIDNEIDPMILITVEDAVEDSNFNPLLIGFDKHVTEKIINSPLNAMYIPEFLEKLKSCIDHSISLKNYRASLSTSNPITKSPFTRKKIIGAIPLGENQEHVNAANWSLMKLITGGKDLGDKNLWFFVIYLMIKNGLLPYLNEIEPFVKAQVLYRFQNYRTSISLSGLSNLPQTKVLYPTAAWTCLISPFLIPKIPQYMNLFFIHLIHYRELLEILKLYDIQLPSSFQSFADRSEVLSRLLSFFKKNPKLLVMYKKGLNYSTISIHIDENSPMKYSGMYGDLFIPVDGEINDEERLKCIQGLPKICTDFVNEGRITLDELSWLLNFVDVQKNFSEMNVTALIDGMNESDKNKKKVSNFWKAWDDNIDKFNVKISKNTCRPFYYVRSGVSWEMELRNVIHASRPILSFDKYFGCFVESYNQYPTKDEYILYLYKRACLGIHISSTLPKKVRQFTDQVFNRYQEVMNMYSPKAF
eukprot:jgi/Orpsp1_1/1179332/evm.model.c7180000068922.1